MNELVYPEADHRAPGTPAIARIPAAILPLLADDLLEVERVASLIPGARGAAHAVVVAHKHGVLLATTDPQSLGIGVVIHEDDVCELS
jgi:hypothetical protein